MSKFTPGPWEVDHKRTVFPVGQRGLAIAVAELHRKDECEANARLIAAAPALYEVLSRILDVVDFECGASKDDAEEAEELLIKARAAIAQADGEAK